MNIQSEMMGDAMDMMGDGETDQQADEVYSQILGEIGMDQGAAMQTGSGAIAAPAQPVAAVSYFQIQNMYDNSNHLFSSILVIKCRRW